MKLTEALLEMLERDGYGNNEFENILKKTKNPFERKRIKDDYAMCMKYSYRNRQGDLVMESGMTIPLMMNLQSREVMRNVICWMGMLSE